MTGTNDRKSAAPQKHRHHIEDGRLEARQRRSQGIVRDERGQEQPADKERAQRAAKTKRD